MVTLVCLRLRIGKEFIEAWRVPKRWVADATTPFEYVRILDPQPMSKLNREAARRLSTAFPAFAGCKNQRRMGRFD